MISLAVRPSTSRGMDLGIALGLGQPVGVSVRPLQVRPGPAGDGRLGGLAHAAVLVDGVILRNVGLRQRVSAVLHGAGDVLPSGAEEQEPFTVSYRILRPSSLVVLDPLVLTAAGSHPQLASRLLSVLDRQGDLLGLQGILVQLTSIEERLELLLPELADRWGTVTADGVVLPSFLSHTVLATLVGVRRPSLTTALAELSEPGLLRRLPDRRWLLAPRLAGL